MKLSVIVPLYHPFHMDDILKTYAWQDACPDDYEVFFMLTAENPIPLNEKIKSICGEKGLNWRAQNATSESNCVARNRGARLAKGNVVLFIDGDQLIAPTLFSRHIQTHAEPRGIGMGICNINVYRSQNEFVIQMPMRNGQVVARHLPVAGDVVKFVKTLQISQAIGFADWHNMNDFTDYINVVGRNISVDRNAFMEMGLWDENLSYSKKTPSRGWEDLELGLRAHQFGLRFMMVPSWTVHLEHPSMAKDGGIENIVKVVKKYPWFLDRDDWWALRYNRDDIRNRAGL